MTIDEAILDSKNRINDYAKHSYSKQFAEYYRNVAKWLEELKEYKELEEQGLLIKLPCKIEDEVYKVDTCPEETDLIDCPECDSCEECGYYEPCIRKVKFNIFMLDAIGKTIFLAVEEAEQALEKAR